MPTHIPFHEALPSDSFLEYAFLRWVLTPAARLDLAARIVPQKEITWAGRNYRIDYAVEGHNNLIAIELDGFEFHGNRYAFSYDRLRQNDLHAAGWIVIRFSYDSIRLDTERCVHQLQAVMALDSLLREFVTEAPAVELPDMSPDPLHVLASSPQRVGNMPESSFEAVRRKLNLNTLRQCQSQAFAALGNYFASGGMRTACIMSVGAGKTALGVVTSLAFTKQRAMVITPGSVIRGKFDKAFDHQAVGNVLYGLPGGPLIPGCRPPNVLTLDREERPIRAMKREDLLRADIIITNFHSLGTGEYQMIF
jgi:very-short-patch-repair endonuclease